MCLLGPSANAAYRFYEWGNFKRDAGPQRLGVSLAELPALGGGVQLEVRWALKG